MVGYSKYLHSVLGRAVNHFTFSIGLKIKKMRLGSFELFLDNLFDLLIYYIKKLSDIVL